MSRLALYLVAGNEFGVIFSNTLRRELVIVTDAIATATGVVNKLERTASDAGKALTSVLIFEEEGPRIIDTAPDVAHFRRRPMTLIHRSRDSGGLREGR